MLASELESEVVALEIGGQFLFDMADHRDFLGAIVNLGITRDGVRAFLGYLERIVGGKTDFAVHMYVPWRLVVEKPRFHALPLLWAPLVPLAGH